MAKEYTIIKHLRMVCSEKRKGKLPEEKALAAIDTCFAHSRLSDKETVWLACQDKQLPSQVLIRWYQLTRQANNPRTLSITSLRAAQQTILNDSEVLILMQKRFIPPILRSPLVKNTKDSLAALQPKLQNCLQSILDELVWGKPVDWQTLSEKLKNLLKPYFNNRLEEKTLNQWPQLIRR